MQCYFSKGEKVISKGRKSYFKREKKLFLKLETLGALKTKAYLKGNKGNKSFKRNIYIVTISWLKIKKKRKKRKSFPFSK